jgi:DivIVA domain-containing protein
VPVVLLVLVLVVLVAVALVAAGRGALMSEAPPDRAPFALPEQLTAADVREAQFSAAFRGYRMDQVDEVLDRLLAELEARDARIAELEAPDADVQPGSVETRWHAPAED